MAKARSIAEALCRAGVTDLVGLPDNSSAALFSLLKEGGEPVIRLVTREGGGFPPWRPGSGWEAGPRPS